MARASGLRRLDGAGGRTAAVRDGLLFAGAGLLPAVFAVALGLRAVRSEEAAVRREAVSETERAAQHAEAVVAAEIRTAEARLAALAPDRVPVGAEDRRALARSIAPTWAEVVVLDEQLELVGPRTAAQDAPGDAAKRATARSSEACRAAAQEVRAGAPPEATLEGCELARTELGSWLTPMSLLEVLRERPDEASAAMLGAWLVAHADRMRSAERAATREEILASRMTEKLQQEATAALERTDASPSRVAAALRSDVARAALGRGPDERGLWVWRGNGAIGAVRLAAEGGALGFLVDAEALGQAVAGQGEPATTQLRAMTVEPPRSEAPRAVAWLAPGLGVEATLAGGDDLAARTRRSRWGLWATAGASAALALGFALVLFARLRDARRTSELRTSFAAAVSHELRTPIASIRMLAELLEDERAGEESERRETAGAIARESRRLGETVSRLLAWSRMREGRSEISRTRVDLAEVVGDAIDVFEERHPGVVVERTLGEGIVVSVDAALVQLAVMNLLENARKYAPDGAPYGVTVTRTAAGARLLVSDGGPGVPRAQRGRIFEAFERGDDRLSRATEGTGIGLALVRAVARAHGGDATVEEGREGGASFVMDLRDEREVER